jgi:hypothetical protein
VTALLCSWRSRAKEYRCDDNACWISLLTRITKVLQLGSENKDNVIHISSSLTEGKEGLKHVWQAHPPGQSSFESKIKIEVNVEVHSWFNPVAAASWLGMLPLNEFVSKSLHATAITHSHAHASDNIQRSPLTDSIGDNMTAAITGIGVELGGGEGRNAHVCEYSVQ